VEWLGPAAADRIVRGFFSANQTLDADLSSQTTDNAENQGLGVETALIGES
jgi:hypothetical protein